MNIVFTGICQCGGRLKTAEWITVDKYKGRSTCVACGRTELKEFALKTTEKQKCLNLKTG